MQINNLKGKCVVTAIATLVGLSSVLSNNLPVVDRGAGSSDRKASDVAFDPFKAGSDGTVSLPGRQGNVAPVRPLDAQGPGLAALGDMSQGVIIPEIQFSNNEIAMAFQIISDATGWSIFPTKAVSEAKISVWAKQISALDLLDRVVTLAGFIYRREGNAIAVMTYEEYAQHYGLEKCVIVLEHVPASSIGSMLTNFLSNRGKAVVHQDTNTIVLLESEANLASLVKVIEKLDVPVTGGMVIEVMDLEYVDTEVQATTLQEVFAKAQAGQTSRLPERSASEKPGEKASDARITAPADVFTPTAEISIHALARTNQLIIKAREDDVKRVRQLVTRLDMYVEPTTKTYHFIYADAAEIYSGLEQILNLTNRSGRGGGRTETGGGRESGRPQGLTLVEKSNSILLTAPPSIHRVMTSIVESVDVASTYEAGILRTYKLENADITEVATAIRELLQVEDREQKRPGEPKYEGQAQVQAQAQAAARPPEGEGLGLSATEEFRPQIKTRVAVSKATNSVIVLGTARQHRELERLIAELDKQRRQVMIESMIIEVMTTDDLDLGVELGYTDKNNGFAFTNFGLSTKLDPKAGTQDVIVSPGGTAAILRPDSVRAILHAVQSQENVRIMSVPRVLVNDNAEGFINSVVEEPVSRVDQSTVTTAVSFGGFVEAGTQFKIVPHISASGSLRVEYQITLNSFGAEKTGTSLPPPRKTSSIKSEATVPSGFTIIVGGLQTVDETKNVSKVPLLGDVPVLGLAFRRDSTRKQYRTTYLFIKPIIVEKDNFADIRDMSTEALENADVNRYEETLRHAGDKSKQ
jgi:type II secretory pathway component GspD/PulD (secretin)